jgi:hypothetical protein
MLAFFAFGDQETDFLCLVITDNLTDDNRNNHH